MNAFKFIPVVTCCAWLLACAAGSGDYPDRNIGRAETTLDSLYKYYGVPGTALLRENYPFVEDYMATSLPTDEQDGRRAKEFAYLWPFSGTFSAVNALYEATGSQCYLDLLEDVVLPALEEYHNFERQPFAYSSYINSAPESGRFYDDNVWIGMEFLNLFHTTGKPQYLSRVEELWKFIESGTDNELGGGVYWCEQNKVSKNTCSNAPTAVLALKLYQATGQEKYFEQGKRLYHWTEGMFKDPADDLYLDNMSLDGQMDSLKYSYNSGQMIQAASLLYEITSEQSYLESAHRTAASAMHRFTVEKALPGGRTFRMLCNRGNTWFSAVLMRGYCELYRMDNDPKYLDEFFMNMDYAWENCRDGNGLFLSDWEFGEGPERWLHNQGAMVEMFARLGQIRQKNT